MARKVLLADDSVTAQNMGRRILVDAGYEVVTVNNGSSALKKVAESKPDLIVLDVYMPGYGGLEVCQRIRESQETARIPILLTVGKLEPFKAEDANRVRADAFIVKPFEASELLTALTKLEDKIVPQAGNRRSGRFKASDDAAYAKEFGDIENGWKNRLKIPPPHQPRTHEPGSPSDAPCERPGEEAAVPDVQIQSQSSERQDTNSDAPPAVTPTTKEQPQASETAEFPVRADTSVTEDRSGTDAQNKAEADTASPEAVAQDVSQKQPGAHEDEVAAALASLIPSNGHGPDAVVAEPEPVSATMVVAATAQEFSGPRWIAQEVALKDDESSLMLEQEMHKALAALAAADAARMSFSSPREESPYYTSQSTQAGAAHGNGDEPASFASVNDKQEVGTVLPVPTDAGAPTPTQIMVDPDATQELAAYAAAASAGTSAGWRETSVEAVTAAPPAPTSVEPSAPTESKHDADLAAAWASWKQVRDSVSSPEFTSQIADAATTGFKEIRHEEPTAKPESETTAAPVEENGTISIIVDSVLAELKPKLVEEIAKKMKKKQK